MNVESVNKVLSQIPILEEAGGDAASSGNANGGAGLASSHSASATAENGAITSTQVLRPVEQPDQNDRTRSTELVRKWPSLLMRLMNENNDDEWEPVLQRIHSHSHEIRIFGRNGGMTALHAACIRYPPSRIIRAMVQIDPDSALLTNFSGETPLHLAISSASEEVQEILLRARPEAAAVPDQYGDLPLHFLARAGATLPLMEQFLFASPEAISKQNIRGVTPFWLLPRTYLEAEDLEDVLEDDTEDYRIDWDLLILFLRYSYYGKGARNRTEQQIENYESWVVHAAASCPACPREVLRFLCRLFPNQDTRLDSKGCTPLLHACQVSEQDDPKEWDELEDGFRVDVQVADDTVRQEREEAVDESEAALQGGDADFIRQAVADDAATDTSSTRQESVIEILLEWSERSVYYVGADGRLPIAHALVNGKSWRVIKSLIAACPRVLEVRDKPTGLYMFQLAAIYSPSLLGIFPLVRATPDLLGMARSALHQPSDGGECSLALRCRTSVKATVEERKKTEGHALDTEGQRLEEEPESKKPCLR